MTEDTDTSDDQATIKRLATLSRIEYDRARKDAANQMNIRVTLLDGLVDAQRPDSSTSDTDELVEGVEPWHESVDMGEVAERMAMTIKRHCVLSDHTVTAVVLWIVASYSIDSFRIFAKLGVTSPQKRCGKTTFLETVSALCNRALLSSNLTPAVLFRVIEEWQPTLIVDEMDTFIDGNEELRGIINSGHNRKLAYVMRVEGDASARAPRRFSTWTPTILAKIGAFPDTIQDRIISVSLERKLVHDVVERLPANHDDKCLTIRRKCQRWVDDHKNRLSASAPNMPNVNNDRAEDNWLPLLAVAELIGGDWPEKARVAMVAIESGSRDESDDLAIMLLRDIQKLCKQHAWASVVHSAKLIEHLNAMDERPWPTLRNDKGLSAHKLSAMLKLFGIRSGTKRNPESGKILKGYGVNELNEVFNRYLSSKSTFQSVTSLQPTNHAGSSTFQSVTEKDVVTVQKTLRASNHEGCNVVTVQNGFSEKDTHNTDVEPLSKGIVL